MTTPFSYRTGTCGITIAPLVPCTVIVRFAPSGAVNSNDTIEIGYASDSEGELQYLRRDVTGVGTNVSVGNLRFVGGSSGDFGTVVVGSNKALTVTLENVGAGGISGLVVSGLSGAFSRTGGTCGTAVNSGATCTLQLKFSPVSPGTSSLDLTVRYQAGSGEQTVRLLLTGLGAGGGVPVYYSEVRQILNSASCNGCHSSTSGGAKGNWGSTYTSLMAFQYPTVGTPSIVPSNANSRFIVAITSGVPGGHKMGAGGYGALSSTQVQKIISWIVSGAPDDPVGGTPANLTISNGPSFSFGSVNTGAVSDHTFMVSNTGGTSATQVTGLAFASGPFSFKGGAYPGTGGTCQQSIAVGAAPCSVVVRFAPISLGSSSGSLALRYTSGATILNVARSVSGIGVGSAIAQLAFASGSSGVFAVATAREYSSLTVTVKNLGSANANQVHVAQLSAPFVRTGGTCATILIGGGTCTVSLRFSPQAAGSFNGSLAISYNNGTANQSLTLPLSGSATTPVTTVINFADVGSILANKCASCHSSFKPANHQSLLAFKWSGQATPAINLNNPAASRFIAAITPGQGTFAGHVMGAGSYGVLTVQERSKIINWILLGAKNSKYPIYFKPLLGDRYYVTSVIRKVFGETPNVIANTKDLMIRADLRGAPCYDNDLTLEGTAKVKSIPMANDTCFSVNSLDTRLDAEMNPDSTAVAESMRISACFKIAGALNATVLEDALAKAGVSATDEFSDANIKNVYQRFYPGGTPSVSVVNALKALGEESKYKLMIMPEANRPREGWRFILLTLCASSGWQAP